MSDDYGDFEEVKEEGTVAEGGEQGPVRVRLPRKGEFIGVVSQRLGGNRMDIKCHDGKNRNCRVPGKFKRSMWLRINDIVLVQPWPDDNGKGDVIFHYHSNQVNQLRKRGLLDFIKGGF